MEEGSHVRLWLKTEVPLIPENTLKSEEGGILRVPVAGNLESRSRGKVVLLVVRSAINVRVSIERIAVLADLAFGGVQAFRWRLIDKVMPVSIERDHGTVIDADEQRWGSYLCQCGRVAAQKVNRAALWRHRARPPAEIFEERIILSSLLVQGKRTASCNRALVCYSRVS